jgi:hypothetical protein
MSRIISRPTPYFDLWSEKLRRATRPRGRKTQLACHLAAITGKSTFHWQNNISKILRRESLPNAETLLAIDHWLHHNP